MPAAPGETLLTTLFADVHYYLADPASRPQHDRFSKGSYLYVYHNPATQQAKLEVANHAGTPDQDAFCGYLSAATIEYSYKHATMLTIKVDTQAQDPGQWRLPCLDLRNEHKYLYQLHSLDVYLWTEKDAATLLSHLRSVVPAHRMDVKDAPASSPHSIRSAAPYEHRDSMSPVVQQLEKTAIGTTFPPRAGSTVSAQSFPGPPTPATNATTSPHISSPQPVATMGGYNPAAPAAPEPIAYREKTPPPPEDGAGNGLPQPQYATMSPGMYQQNSNQVTPQNAYFGGPPQPTPSQSSFPGHPQAGTPQNSFPGPPTATPLAAQRSMSGSMPPPPPGGPSPQPHAYASQPTSPPPHQQNFNRQSSFGIGGLPGQTQFASYPQQQTQYAQASAAPSFGPYAATSPGLPPSTPGYQSMQPPTPSAPPAYAGHTPLQSPGLPPSQQQHQHQQNQPQMVHGYSEYSYTSAQTAPPLNTHGAYTGDVHSQMYRPTEAEAKHGHGHGHSSRPSAGSRQGSERSGKIEERVNDKVGGLLKRLDKLF